jgi:hypothetical protein
MKPKLFLILFSIMLTTELMAQSLADNNGKQMVVWHKDGSKVSFSLREKPTIQYLGDSVLVKSSIKISYAFQAILKMTFEGQTDPLSVPGTTSSDERPFTLTDNAVTFIAANRDIRVRIVALSGIALSDFIVRKNSSITISLSDRHSILLINVNGVTYKISVP